MNRFIVLVVAFALTLIGPADARGSYPFVTPAAAPITVAGIVGSDGSILHGHGFTVKHDSTGHYLIEFDPGVMSGCAAMTIEGDDHIVASEVFEYPLRDCRFPEWHVYLKDPETNKMVDAIFHFIAVEVPR